MILLDSEHTFGAVGVVFAAMMASLLVGRCVGESTIVCMCVSVRGFVRVCVFVRVHAVTCLPCLFMQTCVDL